MGPIPLLVMDRVLGDKLLSWCIKEHIQENILFLRRVQQYRGTRTKIDRELTQDSVFIMFIEPKSRYEVNITNASRNQIIHSMKHKPGSVELFDPAFVEVLAIVLSDILPRYLNKHPAD